MEPKPSTQKQPPASTSAPPAPLATTGNVHVLDEVEEGRLTLDEGVVAKIVGLAVREVPGVHALAPRGTGETIANIAHQITGHEVRDLGVHVELGRTECAIDVRIVCDYGVSIPDVAKQIREVVTRRVRDMTGLRVRELNIEVADLHFEAPPPRRTRELR